VIVSHSRRFIFIKSEKTGGTSVEAALSKHCREDDIVTPLGDYWFNRDELGQWIHREMNTEGFLQHDSAEDVKRKVPAEVWDAYFKFSIARNPWDRVVSDFWWQARHRAEMTLSRRWYHRLGVPFDEFGETRKRFRDFVASDWRTNDRFYLRDGSLCVDFVIRYERLSEDLGEVCRRVELPPLQLARLKVGFRPGVHGYRDYYDESGKAIVQKRHENDIRLFGYAF
jgi:hypothetical protein